tara:strand:+ start:55 stop:1278 length:1224 start_codon:yes stop_codon:yes gene_type:complete
MANVTDYGALVAVGLIIGFLVYIIMNQKLSNVTLQLATLANQDTNVNAVAEDYKSSMQDTFRLLAKTAFDEAVAKADLEKESSFKGATTDLRKTLNNFNENINRFERESIARDTKLKSEISTVASLGIKLSEDTQSLTNALKADAHAQGAWGELVLENLLQSMGFVEGRDYIKQLSETAADRKRKRTDFIINLPDDRQVIIDSKVSLKAWDRFVNAENEEEAENAMKDHCESIAKHAKKLASIRYQDMESVNSVEFVLMFVPLESAFGAAMRQSPELYMDLAGNVNVKVVTGATIMTALLLIKEIWKRELQSHNQIKLIEESGKLYDKIVGFLESFTQVGFELKQATSAYDTALTRLSEGSGNVIKRTENLKELGARVTKQIKGNKDIKEPNLLENANYSHDNSIKE